jgi:aminopeptidase N
VFPVFDQPDLKAGMKLTIITHEEWVAVSNAPEKRLPLD